MPTYRLRYFNVKGRAEAIRWIFVYANQPYIDERLDKDTEWKDVKPSKVLIAHHQVFLYLTVIGVWWLSLTRLTDYI